MKLINTNGDTVNFGETVQIIRGVQSGNKAKNNLLKVRTAIGIRIYSPSVLGLKWCRK